MDKAILNEEENLFQKIINLFPKNNNSSEKKDKLSPKHLLPPNIMKCQIIKKLNNKSESSSLNDNLSINSLTKDKKFINISTIQTKNDIPNTDNLNLNKNELNTISCQIPLKEEENNSISPYSKKSNKKQKTEKEKNADNKFCGKKRKKPKSNEKNVENYIDLNKNEKAYKKTENKKNNTLNEKLKDESEKIIFCKEILLNLVKKEGFQTVFNCLNIIAPLNRKNTLEKKIDEIINKIGLLRTTIALLEIKFENNVCIEINNSTPKKVIKLEDNNDIGSLTQNSRKETIKNNKNTVNKTNIKKKSNKNKKSNKTLKKNNSQIQKSNKKNTNIYYSPKSRSVQKDLEQNKLQLGLHLQKDKHGKIYRFYKHHIRANNGNKIYVFYCTDKKCKSRGFFYMKSLEFEITIKHNLKYEEHTYSKSEKYKQILEEFEKRDCNGAQIFNKDNEQLVKWYD